MKRQPFEARHDLATGLLADRSPHTAVTCAAGWLDLLVVLASSFSTGVATASDLAAKVGTSAIHVAPMVMR